MTRAGASPVVGGVEVAVLFDRLGPYHCARLLAGARRLQLLAVEFCGQTTEYAWDLITTGGSFQRVTLFPWLSNEEVPATECRQKLFDCLDAAAPSAVAVPGWASKFALSGLKWCADRRRPAIIMSESTAWDDLRRPWKEAVKCRLVNSLGSAGLVGGEAHADYLARLGIPRDRVFFGYDAVDNEHFERGASAARAAEGEERARLGLPSRYFLASSRFIEKKNLPRLLDAYASYKREAGSDAWSLVLLGDGPQREALIQKRHELGLEAQVFLPGFKQYDDLPRYYALARGFVHASSTEQWGLVVNEAMAAGLPVLVSERCGCALDLVTEGVQGWTFNPAEPAAITQAMVRLSALSDEECATMGRAARERIACWSPEAFGAGLQRAVQAACEKPPRSLGVLGRLLLEMLMRR